MNPHASAGPGRRSCSEIAIRGHTHGTGEMPDNTLHAIPKYAICIYHMAANKSQSSIALQRAGRRQWVLKPQDLAVALKLVVLGETPLPYAELAKSMRLSPYEAHAAVQRLTAAGLVADLPNGRQPVMKALKDFMIHGARYAFPPVRGEPTIGTPTAHAADPLKQFMSDSDELPPVWPHPSGKIRGRSLLPLYPKLPEAAENEPELYEMLSLFDALRSGQARERQLARKLLEERLG